MSMEKMERDEGLDMSESCNDTEIQKWYENITYEDAKVLIKTNIISAARSFIAIGFYLKRVRDNELYREDGHASIWEFARSEYDISKSTASRYMSMNDRFSDGGNSPVIADPYRDFGKSQLQEMLSLDDSQLEQVTPDMPVMDIREFGRTEQVEEEIQIPGQMDIVDFPELLPVDPELQGASDVNDYSEAAGEQPDVVATVAIVISGDDNELICQEEIPDAEYTEIADLEEEEAVTDLELAREELYRAKNLLDRCADLPDGNSVHMRRLMTKVAAMASYVTALDNIENPPPKPEQPDLPILKNNDQRAAFVDAYETWPLWIETKETGERYYRYDLEDGTSIVIKVYRAMLFDYRTGYESDFESRYKEGYGRQEYYLLQSGKFFRDCDTNRSALIEKLKEIQKKG